MRKNDIQDTYGLSPIQQGMLFHSLYDQHSGVDIEQMVCTLREDLDVPAFRRAWARVLARHPSLRASFRWEGLDRPLQDIHAEVELAVDVQDWRALSAAEQAHRLETYLASDRQQGFELSQAPLMRLALFRVGDADYRFVWTFHHIIADGRSHLLVLEELFGFYEAFCRGQDLRLAQPRPYRDHVAWLEGRDPAASEPFWRGLLQDFTAPTPLVGEAGDHGTGRGEQSIRLPEATTSALRDLARTNRCTLNTLVQGAWALLLSRYSGEEDVVFGAVRACRRSTVEGADAIVGMFINTLPVRVRVPFDEAQDRPGDEAQDRPGDAAQDRPGDAAQDRPGDAALLPWLQELRAQHVAVRDHEHTPLVDVQGWSEVPPGTSLFESVVVFDTYLLDSALRQVPDSQNGRWQNRTVRLVEQTNYPLMLYAYGEPELLLKIAYDRGRFDDATVARMLGHLQNLLAGMAQDPGRSLAALPLLSDAEKRRLLVEWNDTGRDYPREACIHQLIEAQVARTPDAPAVVFEADALTYRQLNARANQLARYLIELGVGPETPVGIFMERSLDTVVGLLGILKAGGAYVPLDPAFPEGRIAFMVQDTETPVLLTQERLLQDLPPHQAQVVCLDADWPEIAAGSEENVASDVTSDNLAYVMFTSGSTGKPKGVMVRHRNVANFIAGMDERIPHDPPGVWLAVTTLSFDISVLELFWTLARGFKVVLFSDKSQTTTAPVSPHADREIDFSLFYFASDESEQGVTDKYRLLLEGARFADRNGLAAVWTPERHFHAFGGLYPNPSVAGAAIAAATERVGIRAGSCVLPLHHPIRVAEEWAVVDNISGGRVGISFAAGWQPNDFVLSPENHAERKAIMFREIETVRRLWRGETLTFSGVNDQEVAVRTLPRPVQSELPVWITAAGNPETFRMAGEGGFNILTHLLGQSVDELAEKVAVYRQAWAKEGHPGQGQVTVMLHTLVGDDDEAVREIVREPMTDYLRSSVGLIKQAAWSFPALKQRAEAAGKSPLDLLESQELSEADMEALLAHAFDRYFETSGLFGTPETCLRMVNRLKGIGVDEIACLVDFGASSEAVLSHLTHLKTLKELAAPRETAVEDYSVAAQIKRHRVTHLQCTPSMAGMLTLDERAAGALGDLQTLMVGGEAFPVALANKLDGLMSGDIINMYGPTETTVWSSTYGLDGAQESIPIGRPIANTQLYILDQALQPVPVGVAGELFIGGEGVARGYLNRPELTAERFIDDPFSDDPQARLYRTGDMARYRPDGNVEFLGRMDFQVKVRGHRIELGEIETALDQHPAVRQSVVVARDVEGLLSEKRLIAYLVPNGGRAPTTSELRDYVQDRLPDYMIPAAFVPLDAFPLTPNGKVNRKALPEPDHARPELAAAFVAPRNAIEQGLAEIWSEALGVTRIGVHDNFFDLGGHSLSAVQVAFKIRQAYGIDLPLHAFLDGPTLARLSAQLEGLLLEGAETVELEQLLQEIDQLSEEEILSLVGDTDNERT